MPHISEQLQLFTTPSSVRPKGAPRNENEEIINDFMDEVNSERASQGRPRLSYMAIKMKLYAIRGNNFELRRFLSECRDYKNRNGSFCKLFFGATKKDGPNFYADKQPIQATI